MNAPFQELAIKGVFLALVQLHTDTRGWLAETFRLDWLSALGISEARPVMAYVSVTRPGVVRGPHEHRFQTDYFGFLGPSDFQVFLWDNRSESASNGRHLSVVLGASKPGLLIVPPGVVHAYKNIGPVDGLVLNYPNKLYAGWNRKEPVDEIRHEERPDSPFVIP
ncbi:MAG: dTDP-4-dehydrorhamnose 3,5-epimerase family protein [candidate division WOR-3 bacterium]